MTDRKSEGTRLEHCEDNNEDQDISMNEKTYNKDEEITAKNTKLTFLLYLVKISMFFGDFCL